MRIRNLNGRLARLETKLPVGHMPTRRPEDLELLTDDDIRKLRGICVRAIERTVQSRLSPKDRTKCAPIVQRYQAAEVSPEDRAECAAIVQRHQTAECERKSHHSTAQREK